MDKYTIVRREKCDASATSCCLYLWLECGRGGRQSQTGCPAQRKRQEETHCFGKQTQSWNVLNEICGRSFVAARL
jgi:hypothetical protein